MQPHDTLKTIKHLFLINKINKNSLLNHYETLMNILKIDTQYFHKLLISMIISTHRIRLKIKVELPDTLTTAII